MSVWASKVVGKISTVRSSQTTEFSVSESGTNTSHQHNVEVQTEAEDIPKEQTTSDVDDEKLAKWLKKIFPTVHKELSKSQEAFKNYRLLDDLKDVNSRTVQSIKVLPEFGDIALKVSALAWNCSGRILGVACSFSHISWCHHEGFVSIYSMSRDDRLPSVPAMKLNVQACPVVLRFHPNIPTIVAAGTYSGGIIIWNIQHEEENCLVNINGHAEGITQLSWINDLNFNKTTVLVTSSLDGLLILWDFYPLNGTLKMKERFKIKSSLLSKASLTNEPVTNAVRGIICFDFSMFVPDMFVVGTEGGLVVQCSLLGTTPLKGSTNDKPLSDPVYKYYQPLKGEIVSISLSPNLDDMFMTNGSDGEIRVYIVGQEEPAQVVHLRHPLNCISWIPFEEKIVGGCGKRGSVDVLNIVEGKLIDNTGKETVEPINLIQMDICRARTNMVAVVTENGHVQLWSVPWNLFSALANS